MNFFRRIIHQLRHWGADVAEFVANQVDSATAALLRAIVFIFGLLLIGTLVGYFYPQAASYIFAINFFVGGFLLMILAARIGVLITILPAAYNFIRNFVHDVTDAVPGPNAVNLPDPYTRFEVDRFYQLLWATLATLQLISAFAIVVPVHTSPFRFLIVLGSVWLILFGALAVGVGGDWIKKYAYLNVGIGVTLLLGFALAIVFPNIWSSFIGRINDVYALFTNVEGLAETNYWIALLLFIAVVGFLVSLLVAYFWDYRGAVWAVAFAIGFLFLVFLGPRTVTLAENTTPSTWGLRNSSDNNYTTPSTPSSSPQSDSVVGKGGVYVDAKDSNGVDSGIVVKSGSVIEVQASGKAVWKNIPVGNPTKYEETGPNGTLPNQSPLMSESEYWSNIDQYLCPSARKGALIAKVGNGPWFYVGDNYKGGIQSNGKLVFAINDLDPQKHSAANWRDNSKGFQVTVKVS